MGFFPTDIGAQIKGVAVGAGTATAASTGDATKVTGQTIDRKDFLSGVLMIAFKAALTEDKTISFAVEIEESADGSNFDTAVALQTATVAATGGSSGSTEYGVVEIDENLKGRKRYVRYNITPDLSHSGTDTLTWAAALVLGGAVDKPV